MSEASASRPGGSALRGTLLRCCTASTVRLGALVVVLGIVDLWVYSVLAPRPVPLATSIGAEAMRPELGKAYYGAFDLDRIREAAPFPWIVDDRSIARLQLYEDNKPLGPGRALHDDIRKLGAGRYDCDFQHTLRFSASDSTDPRTNGKKYVASVPLRSRSWLAWLLAGAASAASLATLALIYRSSSRSTRGTLRRMVVGLPVILAAVLLLRADTLGEINKRAPQVLFAIAILGAVGNILRLLPIARLRDLLCDLQRHAALTLMRWGLPASVGICLAAIVSTWRMAPVTDFVYPAFLGHLPYSDAGGYLSGAQLLIDQCEIDSWNCRRPLNAALLAVRMGLGGGEYGALALQGVLLGLAMYFAARAVSMVAGIWAGLGLFAAVLGYAHTYIASTLSETLGISLGCTSLGLFMIGIRQRRLGTTVVGMIALSLAMNARASTMFMLPCVGIAATLVLWKTWRKAALTLALFALAAVSGFAMTFGLISIYGASSEGAVNANFAQTILGLAKNKDWSVSDEGIEHLLAGRSIKEQTEIRYAKAWELIREDPKPFFRALERGTKQFTNSLHSEFFQRVAGSDVVRSERTRTVLLVLMYGGLALFLLRERKSLLPIWAACWLGVWLSVPLIFIDAGWRVMAPSIPFLSAIFVLGLGGRSVGKLMGGVGADACRGTRRAATVLTLSLMIAAIAGPALVHAFSPGPPSAMRKQPVDTIVVSSDCSAVLVAEEGAYSEPELPSITPGAYRQTLKSFGQTDHEILLNLETPFCVLKVFDYASPRSSYGAEWVVGRPEDFSRSAGYMVLRIEQIGASVIHRIAEVVPSYALLDN